jgi:hypothetical protein
MASPRDPKASEVTSSIATSLYSLHPERLRSFVLPREHGAWGILLVPLLTGAWIGFATRRGILPIILFVIASLALFCLRTPLEIRLGMSPLRMQSPAIALLPGRIRRSLQCDIRVREVRGSSQQISQIGTM